nr:MAG TPA: hypothetical protein [Caudoviricetes sp.]
MFLFHHLILLKIRVLNHHNILILFHIFLQFCYM